MTLFREGGKDSPVSIRRILAAFFSLCFVAASWYGFKYIDKGWIVFIPAIASLLSVLLLLFFTTWNDITALIQAAGGIKLPSTTKEE
jgi:hypothetical protein